MAPPPGLLRGGQSPLRWGPQDRVIGVRPQQNGQRAGPGPRLCPLPGVAWPQCLTEGRGEETTPAGAGGPCVLVTAPVTATPRLGWGALAQLGSGSDPPGLQPLPRLGLGIPRHRCFFEVPLAKIQVTAARRLEVACTGVAGGGVLGGGGSS